MSYTSCKKIVDGIVDNFSNLQTVKIDFLAFFVMKSANVQKLYSLFVGNVQLQLKFVGPQYANDGSSELLDEVLVSEDEQEIVEERQEVAKEIAAQAPVEQQQ